MKRRGITGVEVLLAIVIVGGAIAWFMPTKAKTDAKNVDNVTTKIENSNTKKEGQVSASLDQIAKANSTTADSPEKTFIDKEVSLVKPLLAPADFDQQLAAEKRRIAVMEGKIEEIDRLYKKQYSENKEMIAENTALKNDLQKLKNELYEAAGAAELAKKITIVVTLILLLVGALYIWLKVQHQTLFGGIREFVTYAKDDKTLADLRESFDSSVKKKLGL